MLLAALAWLPPAGVIQAQAAPPEPAKAAAEAAKPNAADLENQRLAAEAAKLGNKPEGVLPLLELIEGWDGATPSRTLALLEKLATDKRLSPSRAVMVKTFVAQGRSRVAKPPAAKAAPAPASTAAATAASSALPQEVTGADEPAEVTAYEALGFATRYRVVGPFDNEGKAGFDTVTPPEEKKLEPADLNASYEGRERPVRWRELPERAVRRGFLPLGALLRPRQNVCALAETFVYSDVAQPLTLWAGAGGAIKVYWNGEEVLRDASYRMPSPDRGVAIVGAHKGVNRVLAKVCVTAATWGFYLRVGDARGGVAKNVQIKSSVDDGAKLTAGHAALKLPKAPEAPLVALERAAASNAAPALYTLAKFLRFTGGDDPAERRAKQLAARAAELDPKLEHLELAAEAAEERAEIMRFSGQAFDKHGKQSAAVLLQARVLATGPSPEDALPLIERIQKADALWPAAQLLRAAILRDLELARTALKVVQEVRAQVGDTAEVLRTLSSLYQAASDPTTAIELQKTLLTVRADDVSARRVLIADALQRGAMPEVHEQLEAFGEIAYGTTQTLLYVAGIYDALGRDDLVLATYRAGIDLVPEAAELYTAYGRALLRADQPELAAEALARALALRPQDAQTRELLEQIRPRQRPDEAYAIKSEELLKLRTGKNGYSSTVLASMTVKTVFENGLGSSFLQHAAEVHDDEGARQYRTFPIQFDPDAQRVDVRLARVYRKDGRVLEAVRSFEQALGEPWYRIYYDTRALVVVFPDLQPGDVVEIRYRVDDIAHRNLFADYFGDLHPLQGFSPTQRTEYVLITPASRKFYVHKPELPGLTHEQKVEGTTRIDHFRVAALPAIVGEASMPGLTEIGPYLHISTYESWQAVGKWYWGLIRDQLYADASLKKTVADVIKGATTTREKVERIHHWVVSNTRYVGLEFGIHGFLPYRVPLIVQRGFGDCKDKASLTYTMLREAGVDARIVLVRTRRNGDLASSPASLAAFDHAISYVPELDLFLDGTAEHSGTRELPIEDQGVTVLVVGPNGAELRKTPIHAADQSRRTRTLRVQLEADGSATVDGEEIVAGADAAGYRDHYQAVGTRKERFQRALGDLYPGLTLEAQSFESLSDIEQPVKYKYQIKVPQLATLDNGELRIALSTMRDLSGMARLPTRKHTLDLRGNRSYREQRSVRLPKGMSATNLPPGGQASSQFGTLKLELSRDGEHVVARTELDIVRDRIAPADYPEFRKWVLAADELLRQRIGITKAQEGSNR
jgi:transglutaminase-like putative cysteine protease